MQARRLRLPRLNDVPKEEAHVDTMWSRRGCSCCSYSLTVGERAVGSHSAWLQGLETAFGNPH